MSNAKITELPEATAITDNDLLVMVDEPSGICVTKKITVANFAASYGGLPSDVDENTLGGTGAGEDLYTGSNNNTFIGFEAGQATGSNNIISNNVGIGHNALHSLINNGLVGGNVAIGGEALYDNTNGAVNTAVGYTALFENTEGLGNVAIGAEALVSNLVGSTNTAVGYGSMAHNTGTTYGSPDGSNNTAVGYGSLLGNTTGYNNVAVGTSTLSRINAGMANTAIGDITLSFAVDTTGNTAVGYGGLYLCTSGNKNVAVGSAALGKVTTGSNNVGVGMYSGYETELVRITTASNYVVLGNKDTANAVIKVAWTVVSDERDKTEVSSIQHGLDFVSKLTPVSFKYKTSREDSTPAKDGKKRYGFLAQDILKLEGENPVIIDNRDLNCLKFDESSLIPILVKAIQELKLEIEKLKEDR